MLNCCEGKGLIFKIVRRDSRSVSKDAIACRTHKSEVDGGTYDSKTGEVSRPKTFQASGNKAKFIQSAMKARQMKNDLMLQTGILPKDPEKLYHAFDVEKREKEDEIGTAISRTPDEIRKDIEALLSKGRTL